MSTPGTGRCAAGATAPEYPPADRVADGDRSAPVSEEAVGAPARTLLRLTETKPDGRRLTRYRLLRADGHRDQPVGP